MQEYFMIYIAALLLFSSLVIEVTGNGIQTTLMNIGLKFLFLFPAAIIFGKYVGEIVIS